MKGVKTPPCEWRKQEAPDDPIRPQVPATPSAKTCSCREVEGEQPAEQVPTHTIFEAAVPCRRTPRITCGAGGADEIPRIDRMPARSTASVRSAMVFLPN